MTIPAGTYNGSAFAITGWSIVPDSLIEVQDETFELGSLTGSQIQVGDANGDGTVQGVHDRRRHVAESSHCRGLK
ncbi:MAG: hypothetical protein H6823_11085 [Planctomycetaceae bacterium]|nr:hypothetical protein [Planctomycetales bacterium]MCB9938778.1 hypothetical protein [Planctomycetaceae bacterium]